MFAQLITWLGFRGMGYKAPVAKILPNPTEVFIAHERYRKLYCRLQNNCVKFAADQKWNGFSCLSCQAFQEMSQDEKMSDVHGLMWVVAAMRKIGKFPEE